MWYKQKGNPLDKERDQGAFTWHIQKKTSPNNPFLPFPALLLTTLRAPHTGQASSAYGTEPEPPALPMLSRGFPDPSPSPTRAGRERTPPLYTDVRERTPEAVPRERESPRLAHGGLGHNPQAPRESWSPPLYMSATHWAACWKSAHILSLASSASARRSSWRSASLSSSCTVCCSHDVTQ